MWGSRKSQRWNITLKSKTLFRRIFAIWRHLAWLLISSCDNQRCGTMYLSWRERPTGANKAAEDYQHHRHRPIDAEEQATIALTAMATSPGCLFLMSRTLLLSHRIIFELIVWGKLWYCQHQNGSGISKTPAATLYYSTQSQCRYYLCNNHQNRYEGELKV